MRQPFAQNKILVQHSGLSAGVYFFKVENGGRMLAAGKIMVR
jgi:hypothetical protein